MTKQIQAPAANDVVADFAETLGQGRRAAAEAAPSELLAPIVENHLPLVLGVCRRLLPSSDADDAAQAVFVLFWQKAKRLTAETSLAGWLHRTAVHVCRNSLRAKAARNKHERNFAAERPAVTEKTGKSAEWQEIREVLDQEVNGLPDQLRLPFVLFHLEHRSLAEVAEIVGSTVPTVGSWLQRSRERLAARLRRRGLSVGGAALGAILAQHALAEAASPGLVQATIQAAASFSAAGAAASVSPGVAALVKAGSASPGIRSLWYTVGLALALVVGIPLTVTWIIPMAQTRLSPDFPRLQGTWRQIAEERDGRPFEVLPKVETVDTLVISGRSFRRIQALAQQHAGLPAGHVMAIEEGSFVLDRVRGQQALDFQFWVWRVNGIYSLYGDTLTICATSEGPRPDGLSTSPHDRRRLIRYERVPQPDSR